MPNPITLEITSDQLPVTIKMKKVLRFLSSQNLTVTKKSDNTLFVEGFRSENGRDDIESIALEILNNMCDNLCGDSREECCEIYNGCNCGGNECGDRYCFSCNSCEVCLEE